MGNASKPDARPRTKPLHGCSGTTALEFTRRWPTSRADVNRRDISEIELGRNTPGLRLIFKLCDALDVAPSEAVKDVERRMQVQGPR